MLLNTLNFDRAVYYAVSGAMQDNGFVDASGSLPSIIDGDIAFYLFNQAEEQQVDVEIFDDSTILPAISIENDGERYVPGGLGGTSRNYMSYIISVYGKSPSESKDMTEAICQTIYKGIDVYDYTMCLPDASGFPLSGQLIGSFSVENLRNIRPAVPSLSLLDFVRRDITFDIVFFES